MNFSAEKPSRIGPCSRFGLKGASMVTVAAALWLCLSTDPAAARRSALDPWGELFGARPPKLRGTLHRATVPLPRPRPAEAPSALPEKPVADKQAPEADKPAEQAAPAPQPSACRLALTEAIAIAPSVPDIHGPGDCGGEDLVRLEAIVLPDKRQVALKPAAILRCKMAAAIADWIRADIAPLAANLGSTISDLDNFDSYECRGRNRIAGGLLSEHGRANAIDLRAFKLGDGRSIALTDRTVPRPWRELVSHSALDRFPTVLGPGSDWY